MKITARSFLPSLPVRLSGRTGSCMLFFVACILFPASSYADTIEYYIAKLNKRTIAQCVEFDTLRLKLHSDTVHISDTLYVYHWGCGGGSPAGKVRATVIDSASGDTVYTGITYNRGYLVPMESLLAWNKTHPHAVFIGTFGGLSGSRPRVRWVMRME